MNKSLRTSLFRAYPPCSLFKIKKSRRFHSFVGIRTYMICTLLLLVAQIDLCRDTEVIDIEAYDYLGASEIEASLMHY